MKTIEERIEEITEKWENMPNPYGSSVIDSALRELAADLQAEKEKEVAELNDRISWLETQREVECQQKLDAQKESEGFSMEVSELKEKLATLAKDYSEVVAGESEMEELTKLRSLLDEVKRVLGMAENSALSWDMLGRSQGNIAVQIWREDALKLLTRLGGASK